ncbi:MAG: tRNA (N(6)-L-threonylcarbamoyladenosine(37)-C(2))-methylthiotransferase MtaB [Alphaproteobacteria bacterium]|nr:tRNA (N(6)-L-threonylcarbamoyladenosine(37)-C(2))-methylthiotransferase MtaB [Alphaproteobacteria bacterium]
MSLEQTENRKTDEATVNAVDAVRVVTLGCRLNSFESEIIRDHAHAGSKGHHSETVVVNTCAVTAEAERQARQTIRRLRRESPGARIVVTGCAAQLSPGDYAAMPEVNRVLGNAEKLDPARFLIPDMEEGAPVAVSDISAVRETVPHLISGFEGRSRAFLQVQQGCDRDCTFCIIPAARGSSRSIPLGRIVAQARLLAANGYREFVLTGVDLASYGDDLPGGVTLGSTVRRLLAQVPEISRLRMSSLDPARFDEDLFSLIESEPRVMPHLHLSLQAGDDMILRRMKRRHSRDQTLDLCRTLRQRRPGVVFGADLIAGFPTETAAMFENTLSLAEECGLTYLHVFPFSPRPETPAARMPQVAGPERKARAARLRGAGKAALKHHLGSLVGSDVSVLVERPGWGHSETFAPVRLTGDARSLPMGSIVRAKVRGVAEEAELMAEVLAECTTETFLGEAAA